MKYYTIKKKKNEDRSSSIALLILQSQEFFACHWILENGLIFAFVYVMTERLLESSKKRQTFQVVHSKTFVTFSKACIITMEVLGFFVQKLFGLNLDLVSKSRLTLVKSVEKFFLT